MAGQTAFIWVFMQTELHTEQDWSCVLSLPITISQGIPVPSILPLASFQHASISATDNNVYH